jgi:hypothetical protein
MSMKITLECDGCFDVEHVKESLNRAATIHSIVPEGWVWSDPYTHCTYCATCWAGIMGGMIDD